MAAARAPEPRAAHHGANPSRIAAGRVSCVLLAAERRRGTERPIFDRGRILRLGAWYASQHQYELAAREYRRAVELDPSDTASLRRAADLEKRRGAWVDAAALAKLHAERLAERGWKLASLVRYRKLSDLLLRAPPAVQAAHGTIDADVRRVRAAISAHRQRLAAGEQEARVAEQKGDDARVVEISRRMIATQPDNPVTEARLAEALCRLSRVDEAIPAFRLAAETLVELDRIPDAIRVVERILHFRASTEDSLLAAGLYLDRGESNDALRAVSKLSQCARTDSENLDVLLLLGRAFDAMRHSARAAQVRIEMARIANTAGETELGAEIVGALDRAARADPEIRELIRSLRIQQTAPDAGQRSVLASVADGDLIDDAEEDLDADMSVLEDGGFEEISEIWVLPVSSKATRRALDDAEAFSRLRLYAKAETVLRGAIEEEPLSTDLRESLRHLLDTRGDREGYVEETVALAELYCEKEFYDRAHALAAELMARDPDHPAVRILSHDLEMSERAQSGR